MIKNKINSLNPNKSCGPDDIDARILIELVDYIAGPLAELFLIWQCNMEFCQKNGNVQISRQYSRKTQEAMLQITAR